MKNKLSQNQSGYSVVKPSLGTLLDSLPPMIYRIEMTPQGPLIAPIQEKAAVPKKVFGRETPHRVNRIWTDFKRTKANCSTGVVLEGSPGSGKSILVNSLCNKAIAAGMPVLEVTTPIHGDILREVVSAVGECVVLFDEITISYTDDETGRNMTENLVRYLSEESIKGVLNLMVTNHPQLLPDSLRNRPGRAAEYISMFDATTSEVEDLYATLKEPIARSNMAKYLKSEKLVLDEHRSLVAILAKEYPLEEMLLALDDSNTRVGLVRRLELDYMHVTKEGEEVKDWSESSCQYIDIFTVEVTLVTKDSSETIIADVATKVEIFELNQRILKATNHTVTVKVKSDARMITALETINNVRKLGFFVPRPESPSPQEHDSEQYRGRSVAWRDARPTPPRGRPMNRNDLF